MTKLSLQMVNCPDCDSPETKVVNTYYTAHGEIVRQRTCKECSFKFATIASMEETLSPELFKVKVPLRNTPEYKQKICTIERLT